MIIVGNPFSPLANEWFPNPYIHPSLEMEYRRMMSVYFHVPYLQLPAVVSLRGSKLHGMLGPAFLGSWISVAALANIHGRHLLAAAALGVLPFIHTPEIRYLIPALPFLSLAFGMALCLRAWIAVARLRSMLRCLCPMSWRSTAIQALGASAKFLGQSHLELTPKDHTSPARWATRTPWP